MSGMTSERLEELQRREVGGMNALGWFWWGVKCLVFMCILFAGLPVWLILSIMDVFPMRWLAEKLDLDLL